MRQIIEVIVSPTGETTIETKGFEGSACQAASQFLERSLGTKQSEQYTAEFYSQTASEHRLQEGRP